VAQPLRVVSEWEEVLMKLGRMLLLAVVVMAMMIVVALPAIAESQYDDPSSISCELVSIPWFGWWYFCADGSWYPL
jgi:hypothetical protein